MFFKKNQPDKQQQEADLQVEEVQEQDDEIFNFDDQDSGDERNEEQAVAQVQRIAQEQHSYQEQSYQVRYQDQQPNQQYEPGLQFEDDDNLPQLKQENNQIKIKQDLPPQVRFQEPPKQQQEKTTPTVPIIIKRQQQMEEPIQQQQKNQKEQPKQQIQEVPAEYGNTDHQSEINFMDYEESVRGEAQIQHQQSIKEPERLTPVNDQQSLPATNGTQQPVPQEGESDFQSSRPGDQSTKWPFPPKFNMDNFPTSLAMMRNFLTSPLPPGQTLQCFIKRSKSGLARMYPVYHMYTTEGARYLLTAKKVVLNSTSSYIICMQRENLSTKSENYLGRVKSNFMGTEFMMYDNGMNPKNTKNTMVMRNQLGVIYYESNLMSNKGPRKMRIAIPKVSPETNLAKQYMPIHEKEGIQYDYKNGKHDFLDLFINKPPRWNESIQAYVLNFYGRVDKPSVKNFQLIRPAQQESMHFQFGRVDDLNFNLDFAWPFSPLQAMQICVSSFDFKFACE